MKRNGSEFIRSMMGNTGKRRQLLLALSLFVMLGTLAVLTLPASTLERIPTCGLEEHSHDRACYLNCTLEEAPIVTDGTPLMACSFVPHVHTQGCYDGDTLVCGYSDVVFHTHTDLCYADAEQGKTLICPLEEQTEHVHGEECYSDEIACGQEENHVHTDACFEDRIVCGMEDVPGHEHTKECVQTVQVCTMQENHVHTEKCHARVLTCGFAEELDHVHTASCFDAQGHAICGKIQYLHHEHNENCFTNIISGHVHSDACYSNVPQCGHVEHVHTDACYQVAPNGENTIIATDKIEGEGITVEGINGTKLPGDAVATVNQIKETEEKEAVWTELQALLNAPAAEHRLLKSSLVSRSATNEEVHEASGYSVFDISLANAEQLNGAVHVEVNDLNIDLKKLVPENAKVMGAQYTLYHIHDGSVSKPEVDVVEKEHIIQGFSFETENFSTYVLQYTVDFHYEGVDYSIPGENQILLSELIDILNITDESGARIDVADVVDVSFTDDRLVTVEQVSGVISYNDAENVDVGERDFLLTSLEPFSSNETLTLTLIGDREIVVGVTDATVSDITGLLDTISINGTDVTSTTNLTVAPGDNLLISLLFKEKPTTTFDKSGATLTYHLPMGLTLPGGISGTLIPGDSSLAAIYDVSYNVTADGQISFTWNVKEGKELDFQALEGMFIKLDIEVQVSAEKNTVITVGEGSLQVKDEHDLKVVKSGSYDAATNQMVYTIRVDSIGTNAGPITVKDVISGTALSLVQGSAHVNYGPNSANVNFGYDDNELTATISGSMPGGQNLEFTYRADVDLDTLKAGGADNYKYGTPTTTKNDVELSGWTDDNPDNDKDTHSVDHAIQLSTTSKCGSSGIYENGKRTVNWQITANTEHLVGLTTITDKMENGKEKMTYNGNGISVKVYNKAGSLVETIPVSWTDLGVTDASKTWTYTIPVNYQTAEYSFVVDYSTAVDVDGQITSVDVSNTATTDYGQGGSGTVHAEPAPGYKLTFDKNVAENGLDIPNGTVTWDISFDVPASGLSSAVITDYLPNTKGGSLGTFYDGYDSYTIDGLIDGESVTLSDESTTVGEDEYISAKVFTFHKTVDGETVNGLYPTSSGRKVTIHLVTTLDEGWMALENIDDSTASTYLYHTNTAVLQADGKELRDSDQVKVDNTKPTTLKQGQKFKDVGYSKTHNNWGYTDYVPMYSYIIYLNNIDDSCFDQSNNLVINDTFNGKYLAYYTRDVEVVNGESGSLVTNDGNVIDVNASPYQYGTGHQHIWYKDASNADVKVPISDSYVSYGDGYVTYTIPKSEIPLDEHGNYWKQYSIHYYLYVKSPDTLDEMIEDAKAAGGTLTMGNTAVVSNKMSSSTDVTYDVPIVSKSHTATTEQVAKGEYHFTIDINPAGDQLGSGAYLTVTDSYKNLTVDYDSIESIPENALVNLDHSGDTVTYTVRNGMHVVLNYTAYAVKNGDFSNVVKVNAQKAEDSGKATITGRGDSGSNNLKLTIKKHVKGNLLDTLAGVTFELYRYDDTKEDKRGEKVGSTYTTNSEGKIEFSLPVMQVGDNYTDTTDKYVLHEVDPLPGYQALPHDYYFTIDRKTVNYGEYIYLDGDVMPIANEPEEEETLTIKVVKTFVGATSDLPQVTIHLKQKDERLSNKSADDIEVDSVTLPVLDPETGEPTYEYTFENLANDKAYYIVEDTVPGYVATYTNNNELGLIHSGTIGVTNTKQNVKVVKSWESSTNTKPRGLNISAYKDGVFFKSYTIVPDGDDWELNIDDLEYPGEYTFTEDSIEGYKLKSITYSNDGSEEDSAIIGSGTVTIVNEPDDTPEDENTTLKAEKEWYDDNGKITDETELKKLSATVELVRYRAEMSGTTIHFKDAQGGTFASDIIVKGNDTVTVGVEYIKSSYSPLIVSSVANGDYNTLRNGTVGQTEGLVAKATPTYEMLQGNPPYSITATFNTGSYTDLYVIVDEWPSWGGYLVNSIVSGSPLATAGVPGVDPDYDAAEQKTLNWYNDFKATFKGLATGGTGKDGKKYAYTYGLREVQDSDSDFTVSYTVDNADYTEGDPVAFGKTVLVKNTKESPSVGALKFTKQVTLNGEPTTAINGDYTFSITGADTDIAVVIKVVAGVAKSYKIGEAAEFTNFEEGDPFVVIKNLAEGDYVITETNVPAGMITKVSGGKEDKTAEEAESITVHVEPNGDVPAATATATFINNTDQTSVTVRKVWNDDNDRDGKRPTIIQVQLYADEVASGDAVMLNEDGEWTYTWPGLATKNGGNDIVYTVKEVDESEGKITFTLDDDKTVEYSVEYDDDDETGDKLITNAYTPETTTVTATKEWQDKSGTKIDWPEGAEITFGLFVDDEPVNGVDGHPLTCVLDNVEDEAPAEAVEPYAIESEAGVASFVGLPKYKNVEGTPVEIEYVVKETVTFEGYLASDITDEGVIVNKEKETVSIEATKSWGTEDEDLMASAVQFTLYRKVAGSDVSEAPAGAVQIPEDTGDWYEQVDQKTVLPETWSVNWGNLPKYAEDGETEVVYVVKETGVYFGELTEDDETTTNVNEAGQVPTDAVFAAPDMYTVTGEESLTINSGIGTATIINTPITVDVPVIKTWDSSVEEGFTWSATLKLEELEVPYRNAAGVIVYDAVSAHDHAGASDSVWTAVSPEVIKTITNETSQTDPVFINLPKFRAKEDGSVAIIMYSVDEIGYEVKNASGTVIAHKDATTMSGEIEYTPEYNDDADDVTNYTVTLKNTEKHEVEGEKININIHKTWPSGVNGVSATFRLMRTWHTEQKNLADEHIDNTKDKVTIKVMNGSTEIARLENVPVGTPFRLQAGFKAKDAGNGSVRFRRSDNNQEYHIRHGWTENMSLGYGDVIYAPEGGLTLNYDNDGENLLADGLSGVVISDRVYGSATADQPDTRPSSEYPNGFNSDADNVFTLNEVNHWTKEFKNLPQTVVDTSGNIETTTVYGYYFEEINSDPAGYGAKYFVGSNEINENNKIFFSGSVEANNEPLTEFKVFKTWWNAEDDHMPGIVYELYRQNRDSGGNPQGEPALVGTYLLNEEGGFMLNAATHLIEDSHQISSVPWTMSHYIDTGSDASKFFFTAKETGIYVAAESGSNAGKWSVAEIDPQYMRIEYMADPGKDGDQNWKGSYTEARLDPWRNLSKTGQLTIRNTPNPYTNQLHLIKRWHPFTAGGGVEDIRNLKYEIEVTLVRKIIRLDNSEVLETKRYGSPITLTCDGNGNYTADTGTNDWGEFITDTNGEWHYLQHNTEAEALPLYGYFYDSNGNEFTVRYEYTFGELKARTDLNNDGIWETNWLERILLDGGENSVGKAGTVYLMDNFQTSKIILRKKWIGTPKADYVLFSIVDNHNEDWGNTIYSDYISIGTREYSFFGLEQKNLVKYNGNWYFAVYPDKTDSEGNWTLTVDNLPNLFVERSGDGYGERQYTVTEAYIHDADGYHEVDGNVLYTAWYRGTLKSDPQLSTDSAQVQLGRDDENADPDKVTTVITSNIADTELKVEKQWLDEFGDLTDATVMVDGKTYIVDRVEYLLKVNVKNHDGSGDPSSTGYSQEGYITGSFADGRVTVNQSAVDGLTLAQNASGALKIPLTEGDQYWEQTIKGLPSGHIYDRGSSASGQRYYTETYEYEVEEYKVYGHPEEDTGSSVDLTRYFTIGEPQKLSDATVPEEWILFNTVGETGAVQVKKIFEGISELPQGFAITASWNEGGNARTKELTVANADSGDGKEATPYLWEISNLPLNIQVTFVESGYDADGCRIDITVNDVAIAQGTEPSATAEASNPAGTAVFKNVYTPSDVSVKVEKSWSDLADTVSYTIAYKVQVFDAETEAWVDYDSDDADTEPDSYTMTYTAPEEAGGEGTYTGDTVEGLQAGRKYRVVETGYTVIVGDGTHNIVKTGLSVEGTAADAEPWTSSLVNTLDYTTIEGKKIWEDSLSEHGVPELVLSRKSAKEGAAEEIIKAAIETPAVYGSATGLETDVNLQPIWEDLNYIYSELPKYDSEGYEYTYDVKEIKFEITIDGKVYTYTVTADGNATSDPTGGPAYQAASEENTIINTELTQIDVVKKWMLNGEEVTSPKTFNGEDITQIKFDLYKKVEGEEPAKYQTDPFMITAAAEWKLTITGLPKFELVENEGNSSTKEVKYYIVELLDGLDHYTNAITTVAGSSTVDVDSSNPVNSGEVVITNSLYTASLPSTGSIGTKPVYAVGLALMFASLIGFMLKKQKEK